MRYCCSMWVQGKSVCFAPQKQQTKCDAGNRQNGVLYLKGIKHKHSPALEICLQVTPAAVFDLYA